MDTVLTIVRLRWSLTLGILRKSVWQTVGYVISAVIALGAVIGIGALAWSLAFPIARGGVPVNDDGSFSTAVLILQAAVVLVGTFATIIVSFIQLMLIGEGSTMSSHRFELYGIPDSKLQLGLLIGGLSGIPAIAALLSMMLWSMVYRSISGVAVLVALLSAPLLVVTMMSIAKVVISLSTTLVKSKRGKALFYLISMAFFIVACQLPNLIVNSQDARRFNVASFTSAADIFAWTPFGAAFQLPFDAAAGHWMALCFRILILLATCVLCFWVCTWCLRRERLTAGASTSSTVAKGVGAFAWMPDSVSGAVSARLFTYLLRDPRQALMFFMPVLFVVLFSFQSHGISFVVWQALIWSGWFMNMTESNGLSYDGNGFTMQALLGVSGRDDRRGRVRVFGTMNIVYLLVLMVAIFVITGDWKTGTGLLTGFTFFGVGVAVALSALGLAEVLSCVLMYPVASLDKPFSSPQGRALAQGFMPFAFMLGCVVLVIPTGVVGIILGVTGSFDELYWLLAPAGIVNGALALFLGVLFGGKIMDARLLKIVQTLTGFASLQK